MSDIKLRAPGALLYICIRTDIHKARGTKRKRLGGRLVDVPGVQVRAAGRPIVRIMTGTGDGRWTLLAPQFACTAHMLGALPPSLFSSRPRSSRDWLDNRPDESRPVYCPTARATFCFHVLYAVVPREICARGAFFRGLRMCLLPAHDRGLGSWLNYRCNRAALSDFMYDGGFIFQW